MNENKFKCLLSVLLTTAFTTTSNAAEYVVRVPQKIESTWSVKTEYTNWIEGALYNCTGFLPDPTTVNYPSEFTQTNSCNKDMSRNYTTSKYNAFSDTTLIADEGTQEKTIIVDETRITIGGKHNYSIKSCGLFGCLTSEAGITYDGAYYQNYRGWLLVIVNPETKLVEFSGSYDTHGDANAVNSFIAKLNSIPNGYLTILSTWDQPDDYVQEFTSNLQSILRSQYGSGLNLGNLVYRGSVYFSGIKGASSPITENLGSVGTVLTSGNLHYY